MSLSDADQNLLSALIEAAVLKGMEAHRQTDHVEDRARLARLEAKQNWLLGGVALLGLISGCVLPLLLEVTLRRVGAK